MSPKKASGIKITLETRVEEIVEKYPKAVGWLVMHGIVCMACGEPYWGTIGELMEKKKLKNPERILYELNEFLIQA